MHSVITTFVKIVESGRDSVRNIHVRSVPATLCLVCVVIAPYRCVPHAFGSSNVVLTSIFLRRAVVSLRKTCTTVIFAHCMLYFSRKTLLVSTGLLVPSKDTFVYSSHFFFYIGHVTCI